MDLDEVKIKKNILIRYDSAIDKNNRPQYKMSSLPMLKTPSTECKVTRWLNTCSNNLSFNLIQRPQTSINSLLLSPPREPSPDIVNLEKDKTVKQNILLRQDFNKDEVVSVACSSIKEKIEPDNIEIKSLENIRVDNDNKILFENMKVQNIHKILENKTAEEDKKMLFEKKKVELLAEKNKTQLLLEKKTFMKKNNNLLEKDKLELPHKKQVESLVENSKQQQNSEKTVEIPFLQLLIEPPELEQNVEAESKNIVELKPIRPSIDSNSSSESKRARRKFLIAEAPLSPESRKKSELCTYLQLMDLKHPEIKNGVVYKNRRSTRVKNLQILSERKELEKKLSSEARVREIDEEQENVNEQTKNSSDGDQTKRVMSNCDESKGEDEVLKKLQTKSLDNEQTRKEEMKQTSNKEQPTNSMKKMFDSEKLNILNNESLDSNQLKKSELSREITKRSLLPEMCKSKEFSIGKLNETLNNPEARKKCLLVSNKSLIGDDHHSNKFNLNPSIKNFTSISFSEIFHQKHIPKKLLKKFSDFENDMQELLCRRQLRTRINLTKQKKLNLRKTKRVVHLRMINTLLRSNTLNLRKNRIIYRNKGNDVRKKKSVQRKNKRGTEKNKLLKENIQSFVKTRNLKVVLASMGNLVCKQIKKRALDVSQDETKILNNSLNSSKKFHVDGIKLINTRSSSVSEKSNEDKIKVIKKRASNVSEKSHENKMQISLINEALNEEKVEVIRERITRQSFKSYEDEMRIKLEKEENNKEKYGVIYERVTRQSSLENKEVQKVKNGLCIIESDKNKVLKEKEKKLKIEDKQTAIKHTRLRRINEESKEINVRQKEKDDNKQTRLSRNIEENNDEKQTRLRGNSSLFINKSQDNANKQLKLRESSEWKQMKIRSKEENIQEHKDDKQTKLRENKEKNIMAYIEKKQMGLRGKTNENREITHEHKDEKEIRLRVNNDRRNEEKQASLKGNNDDKCDINEDKQKRTIRDHKEENKNKHNEEKQIKVSKKENEDNHTDETQMKNRNKHNKVKQTSLKENEDVSKHKHIKDIQKINIEENKGNQIVNIEENEPENNEEKKLQTGSNDDTCDKKEGKQRRRTTDHQEENKNMHNKEEEIKVNKKETEDTHTEGTQIRNRNKHNDVIISLMENEDENKHRHIEEKQKINKKENEGKQRANVEEIEHENNEEKKLQTGNKSFISIYMSEYGISLPKRTSPKDKQVNCLENDRSVNKQIDNMEEKPVQSFDVEKIIDLEYSRKNGIIIVDLTTDESDDFEMNEDMRHGRVLKSSKIRDLEERSGNKLVGNSELYESEELIDLHNYPEDGAVVNKKSSDGISSKELKKQNANEEDDNGNETNNAEDSISLKQYPEYGNVACKTSLEIKEREITNTKNQNVNIEEENIRLDKTDLEDSNPGNNKLQKTDQKNCLKESNKQILGLEEENKTEELIDFEHILDDIETNEIKIQSVDERSDNFSHYSNDSVVNSKQSMIDNDENRNFSYYVSESCGINKDETNKNDNLKVNCDKLKEAKTKQNKPMNRPSDKELEKQTQTLDKSNDSKRSEDEVKQIKTSIILDENRKQKISFYKTNDTNRINENVKEITASDKNIENKDRINDIAVFCAERTLKKHKRVCEETGKINKKFKSSLEVNNPQNNIDVVEIVEGSILSINNITHKDNVGIIENPKSNSFASTTVDESTYDVFSVDCLNFDVDDDGNQLAAKRIKLESGSLEENEDQMSDNDFLDFEMKVDFDDFVVNTERDGVGTNELIDDRNMIKSMQDKLKHILEHSDINNVLLNKEQMNIRVAKTLRNKKQESTRNDEEDMLINTKQNVDEMIINKTHEHNEKVMFNKKPIMIINKMDKGNNKVTIKDSNKDDIKNTPKNYPSKLNKEKDVEVIKQMQVKLKNILINKQTDNNINDLFQLNSSQNKSEQIPKLAESDELKIINLKKTDLNEIIGVTSDSNVPVRVIFPSKSGENECNGSIVVDDEDVKICIDNDEPLPRTQSTIIKYDFGKHKEEDSPCTRKCFEVVKGHAYRESLANLEVESVLGASPCDLNGTISRDAPDGLQTMSNDKIIKTVIPVLQTENSNKKVVFSAKTLEDIEKKYCNEIFVPVPTDESDSTSSEDDDPKLLTDTEHNYMQSSPSVSSETNKKRTPTSNSVDLVQLHTLDEIKRIIQDNDSIKKDCEKILVATVLDSNNDVIGFDFDRLNNPTDVSILKNSININDSSISTEHICDIIGVSPSKQNNSFKKSDLKGYNTLNEDNKLSPKLIEFKGDGIRNEMKSLRRNLLQNKRKSTKLDTSKDEYDFGGEKSEKKSSHTISLNEIDGQVLDAYYFDYNLIITQDLTVSFWTQSALGFVLEAQNMWIHRGAVQRLALDSNCVRKISKESVTSTENSFAYVELWTKEHKSDKRERPVADVFAVIYFWRNRQTAPEKKFLQLENIKGFADDVQYVVLKNSSIILVSWRIIRDDTTSSIIHCYQLANDFQTVVSIKEMESVDHTISSLHNIEDCDTLVMGCGEKQVTIWNLEFGFIVATIDTSDNLPEPSNLWVKCDRGFLFLLQKCSNIFKLIAINGINQSWKRLQIYKPPMGFERFHGVCIENGILIAFYGNGILCWNVQSGDLIMEEACAEVKFLPSNKHIVTYTPDNLFQVKNALSFLITNYDFSES